jgi:hypothetical protein
MPQIPEKAQLFWSFLAFWICRLRLLIGLFSAAYTARTFDSPPQTAAQPGLTSVANGCLAARVCNLHPEVRSLKPEV